MAVRGHLGGGEGVSFLAARMSQPVAARLVAQRKTPAEIRHVEGRAAVSLAVCRANHIEERGIGRAAYRAAIAQQPAARSRRAAVHLDGADHSSGSSRASRAVISYISFHLRP